MNPDIEIKIKTLGLLKKEFYEYMEKHKNDPNLGMCYSAVWEGKYEILRARDQCLDEIWKLVEGGPSVPNA